MTEKKNTDKDEGNLKVVIRVRPFVEIEKGTTRVLEVYESFSGTIRNQVIQIKNVKGAKFTFDRVLPSNTSQKQMYDSCIVELANKCMEGYNATIIAYGQTGSGKTWTTIGPGLTRNTDPDNEDGSPANEEISDDLDGAVPRTLKDIFRRLSSLKEKSETYKYSVKLQFLELYGEQIRDLLNPSSTKVTIRDLGGDTEPKVIGATQENVKSAKEALYLLEKGALRRKTASTNMNADSSRSHAMITVIIRQESSDKTLSSKLQFVDLAGSERLKRTGAEGRRMKEGIDINKGLLTLANVISALADPKKKKAFVPYRDSKLTHLLKGSIGGNHKTLMITCVSPAASNAEETENSLRYANRAKNIKNNAVVNMDATTTDSAALKSQVQALAVELLRVRSIAGSSASGGPFSSGVLATLAGGKDVKDIEAKISQSTTASDAAMKKLQEELSSKNLQVVECNVELEHIKEAEKEHKRKIQDLLGEVEEMKADKEASQTHLANLKREFENLEQSSLIDLENAKIEMQNIASKLESAHVKVDLLTSQGEENRQTITDLQKELSVANGEKGKFRLQLDAVNSSDVDSILKDSAEKMQALQTSYDLSQRTLAQKEDELTLALKRTNELAGEVEVLKSEKNGNKMSSLSKVSFEKKIISLTKENENLSNLLKIEKENSAKLANPDTINTLNEEKFEELEDEMNTLSDKYTAMKLFYEEKVGSLEATIDDKEEERGQLIVQLNQMQNGGAKKAVEGNADSSVQMEDILRVRMMSMRVLPILLEDEKQRMIAQRNGLTDAILQEMALFPDCIELNASAFHALVLLARPLGGKEGSLFQGSMTNNDIFVQEGNGRQRNGIEIMLDAMRRFDSNELLQAKGCWAIVNIALVSSQRTMLLKRGGIGVITNAMRRHPHDTEVQLRSVSALVNMVKPFDSKEGDQTEERELLDSMVDSIADLVVQAMKNCCSQEVILSRACLVLGNLSFRSNYKSSLVETPECINMLRWCMETYEDNKLIQRCTRDTLQRVGEIVPPKPSKSKSPGNEASLRKRAQSNESSLNSSTLGQESNQDGPVEKDTAEQPQSTAYMGERSRLSSSGEDDSISSNYSGRSSVLAKSKSKGKGFGFFSRSRSKKSFSG